VDAVRISGVARLWDSGAGAWREVEAFSQGLLGVIIIRPRWPLKEPSLSYRDRRMMAGLAELSHHLPLIYHQVLEMRDAGTGAVRYISSSHSVTEGGIISRISVSCPNLGSCDKGVFRGRGDVRGQTIVSHSLTQALHTKEVVREFQFIDNSAKVRNVDLADSIAKSEMSNNELREKIDSLTKMCRNKLQDKSQNIKSVKPKSTSLKASVLEVLREH